MYSKQMSERFEQKSKRTNEWHCTLAVIFEVILPIVRWREVHEGGNSRKKIYNLQLSVQQVCPTGLASSGAIWCEGHENMLGTILYTARCR